MAKVSICVPAYQNPTGIRRLLSSIKEQNFTDYEVILTDDSVDDAVRQAAKESGISNLHYHKNEKRMGATANWNKAVSLAKGEYIKIMHHDDWFTDAGSLGRFVEMLESHPEADIAFCGTWQVSLDQDGNKTGEQFSRGISREHEELIRRDFRNLYLGDYIGAPSATIYKNNGIAYEEKLTWLVDVEFYMRMLQQNSRYAFTTDPLICIGVSKNQLTESCRGNGKLNIFEYGFIMEEFDLSKVEAYRREMIRIALYYKMPYDSIAPYGIPKREYKKDAAIKRRKDFIFLLGVAKRKIFGRSNRCSQF